VITTAAIGLSAYVVLRAEWLPMRARYLIGALAAYGGVAFVWAIVAGTAYPDLFRGQSFLSWLPRWLQGAFLGGAVLLVALVALAAQAARRAPFQAWGYQGLALLLACDLAGAGLWARSAALVSAHEVARLPSSGELASAGRLASGSPQRLKLSAGDLVERAEATAREIPAARYDVAARARELESDVEAAFSLVRDEIRYEAYPGVLRGARGAYAARAGNAFDRSLLLAELLRHRGVPVRFASCRLPRAQAEQLFERIFEPAAAPASGEPQGRLARTEKAFQARVRTRALRDYAAIRGALGEELPTRGSPPRDAVLKEIENHVWVQAKREGSWLDLDSAFAGAEPGQSFCTAAQPVERLPAAARQMVALRVVTETLSGGALQRQTALEFRAAAEDLVDRQIFFTHAPGVGGIGIKAAILGADTWTPALWVDGAFHIGEAVSFADVKGSERGSGPPSGGLGAIFGSGGALASERSFVAEWLELELGFPDGSRELVRRTLVDRADAAWRAADSKDAAALRQLARDAEGLVAPRELHNVWLSAGRHDLAAYSEALRILFAWIGGNAGAEATDEPRKRTFGEVVWPVAMLNFAFLVRSDHFVVPALNDSDHRFYADSPRIVIASTRREAKDGESARHSVQYDLRRDHLRGLARDADAERGVVERKLWFGALEGALEHETLAALGAGGDGVSPVSSTSALLSGTDAVVFRPGEAREELSADPETAARMARALDRGAVLVVPNGALADGRAAWWEIARDGADTRAVLDDLGMGKIVVGVPRVNPPASPPAQGGGSVGPQGAQQAEGRGSGEEYTGVIKDASLPSVQATGWATVTYGELFIYFAIEAILLGGLLGYIARD
jgi:transglutaminase-like putative cysteine protease